MATSQPRAAAPLFERAVELGAPDPADTLEVEVLAGHAAWDSGNRAHGIDLAPQLQALRAELPMAPLPDSLVGPMAARIMQGALSLGLDDSSGGAAALAAVLRGAPAALEAVLEPGDVLFIPARWMRAQTENPRPATVRASPAQ